MQRILLISLITTLAVAAPAIAQTPVQDAYGGAGRVASEVANSGDGPGAVPAGAGNVGTADAGNTTGNAAATGNVPVRAAASPLRGDELPFTGLDVGLVAVGGLMLLALGVGVRRVSREPRP